MAEIIVEYEFGGEIKTATATNADVAVKISETETERTVEITALKDIKLSSVKDGAIFTVSRADSVFLNGYQSWTDTKEFYLSEKERDVKKIPKILNGIFAFDRYGDALMYDYGKDRLHGYDVFYSRGERECFFLNANYKTAYLVFEVNRKSGEVTAISDYGGMFIKSGTEMTVLHYYIAENYSKGIELLDKLYPKKNIEKIFGYTSWYNYYQNIDEQTIRRDLAALDGRFNLFQIDDGYETFVGDWLDVDKKKFPCGLDGIVEEIHRKGLKAGIWLAPFVAEEKSRLFRDYRGWFKTQSGEPVRCGANWSGFYALDFYKPEVRDYIKKCLTYYKDMGFDFFKLDFLYAVSLPVYENKTRSQVAEEAYSFIREVLGDKLILGCGATVFNAIDKFDYLRIGPDVSLKFDDVWYMRRMHRERISTKVTLQNTVYRSIFGGRFFGNDPDVFLLRDDNISLSDKQKQALLTINALFGDVMMTSDNVGDYDGEKEKYIDKALALYSGAKVTDYRRRGRFIEIEYDFDGISRRVEYDVKKGVLV